MERILYSKYLFKKCFQEPCSNEMLITTNFFTLYTKQIDIFFFTPRLPQPGSGTQLGGRDVGGGGGDLHSGAKGGGNGTETWTPA